MYPFCLFVVDDYDEMMNEKTTTTTWNIMSTLLMILLVCLFVLSVYCYFSSCLSVIQCVIDLIALNEWMNEDIFYGKLHWFDLNDVKYNGNDDKFFFIC